MSFDRLLSGQDILLLANRPEGVWNFGERRLNELLRQHEADSRSDIDKPWIVDLLATLVAPAVVREPPQLATSTALMVVPATTDVSGDRYQLAKRIARRKDFQESPDRTVPGIPRAVAVVRSESRERAWAAANAPIG
jgi:hypothetical protein